MQQASTAHGKYKRLIHLSDHPGYLTKDTCVLLAPLMGIAAGNMLSPTLDVVVYHE